MVWIFGLALAALLIYLLFSRKSKANELVIRIETNVAPSYREADVIESEIEEKDNWEPFDFYSATMVPAKGRYRINYEDQRGLKTEREIVVKRVNEFAGKYAIDAHCMFRNGHRSFLNERIQRAINLESGEIVDDLALDAIAQFKDSGEGRALGVVEKEWMGVSILVFVCRADGQMRKPERTIIADYLKRRHVDMVLDDELLDASIKSLGEPDHREFKRIIRDLKTAGDYDRLNGLLDCAKRIVDTQKTITPMEKAAIELLTEATA